MNITPLGSKAAQRRSTTDATNLMAANGNTDIADYVHGGNCYDAVAFVKFLLGAVIQPNQLLDINGQGWLPLLNYQHGTPWNGGAIARGTAVVFCRPNESNINAYQPFHASLAIGGTTVRGLNGHVLGHGWTPAGDSNLAQVLTPGPQGTFRRGQDTYQVWLSPL